MVKSSCSYFESTSVVRGRSDVVVALQYVYSTNSRDWSLRMYATTLPVVFPSAAFP